MSKAEPTTPQPPPGLAELQQQFGDSISQSFKFAGKDGDYRLRKENYHPKVVADLCPSGSASGADRLGTYNQQYWFRLLSVMQEEFPLLRHLLGLLEFNQLTMAYLTAYPSRSPLLQDLAVQFEQFLQQEHRWHKRFIQQCAQLEWILSRAFLAEQKPQLRLDLLSSKQQQQIPNTPLEFQPHFSLFSEDWDLVASRRFAKLDSEDAVEISLIEYSRDWAIFRGADSLQYQSLKPHQYQLLQLLSTGNSLVQSLDELSKKLSSSEQETLGRELQSWFHNWAALGWFVQPISSASSGI